MIIYWFSTLNIATTKLNYLLPYYLAKKYFKFENFGHHLTFLLFVIDISWFLQKKECSAFSWNIFRLFLNFSHGKRQCWVHVETAAAVTYFLLLVTSVLAPLILKFISSRYFILKKKRRPPIICRKNWRPPINIGKKIL